MQSPLYYATAEYDNYDSNQQYEDVKEDLIKLKKFRCTTCNKTFQHLHHLKRHVSSVNTKYLSSSSTYAAHTGCFNTECTSLNQNFKY